MTSTPAWIIAFSLCAFLTACSPPASNTPLTTFNMNNSDVINGTPFSDDSLILKSTVVVVLPFNKSCSGVLLNNQIVLTAAHCIKTGVIAEQLSVVNPNAKPSCFSARVSDIALAPKVSDREQYSPDLALLKLATTVCMPAPASLANITKSTPLLTATGFGNGSGPGTNSYLKLQLTAQDLPSLKSFYADDMANPAVAEDWNILETNYPEFSEQYLFALAKNSTQSLCFGDSGGAVFYERDGVLKIVGVVGGGLPHATKGVTSCQGTYLQVFAPVQPSRQWILQQIKQWSTP